MNGSYFQCRRAPVAQDLFVHGISIRRRGDIHDGFRRVWEWQVCRHFPVVLSDVDWARCDPAIGESGSRDNSPGSLGQSVSSVVRTTR